jgi:hypothetical protein
MGEGASLGAVMSGGGSTGFGGCMTLATGLGLGNSVGGTIFGSGGLGGVISSTMIGAAASNAVRAGS